MLLTKTISRCVTLLCVITFSQAFAQLNNPAEKGYLVTATGDTVRGFVHYNNIRNLYKKVSVSESPGGPTTDYTPATAQAYYLEGTNQMFISGASVPALNKSGSFIRVLVDGNLDLLQLPGKGNSRFIARKGETIAKLQQGSNKTQTINGQQYNTTSKPYLKSLQPLLEDCIKDTLKTSYSAIHLSALVTMYNECTKTPTRKYASSNKSIWTFGFTLGSVSSGLSFEDKKTITRPYQYPSNAPDGTYDLSELTGPKYSHTSFAAGVAVTLYPKSSKRLSFASELLFSGRKWKGPRADVSLGYLQIPVAVRYHFLNSKSTQPVIGVGADIMYNYKSTYNTNEYSWKFSRSSPAAGGGDTYPPTFNVSMPTFLDKEFHAGRIMPFVTAGFEHHRPNVILSFSYRYEFNGSITKSRLYDTKVSNNVLVLCASFWKKKKG